MLVPRPFQQLFRAHDGAAGPQQLLQHGEFLLSALGGGGGLFLGILVTSVYAIIQGWPSVVPAWAMAGGLVATLVIGAVAGLYPAVRAARLAPAQALAHAG